MLVDGPRSSAEIASDLGVEKSGNITAALLRLEEAEGIRSRAESAAFADLADRLRRRRREQKGLAALSRMS